MPTLQENYYGIRRALANLNETPVSWRRLDCCLQYTGWRIDFGHMKAMRHLPRERSRIKSVIREHFQSRPECRLVILFGSVATGTLTARSDVDLAVAGPKPFAFERLLDEAGRLELLLGRPVDLIDLNTTEGLILHRAVTRGLCLKPDEALMSRFYAKALGWVEDFRPLQRAIRAARIQEFVHGSGCGHGQA